MEKDDDADVAEDEDEDGDEVLHRHYSDAVCGAGGAVGPLGVERALPIYDHRAWDHRYGMPAHTAYPQ